MKYTCSSNNNYEIIGLCDILKFNEKISSFTDKSWTQIIIPGQLKVPINSPNLKSVVKCYVDVKVVSTKIVDTASSTELNVEGLKSTGKILLVDGEICQKVIYIADNFTQSVHSIKFKDYFSTYVVIDGNADKDNDNYCVYPCIEDVFIRMLDNRTLAKSIAIFLFANKTSNPVVQKLPNAFVYYNDVGLITEIVRIEFDKSKTLIVTSTGEQDTNYQNDRTIFSFTLYDSSKTEKYKSSIMGTQSGDAFALALNGKPFEVGDLILINYEDNDKTTLSNYPNENETYIMQDDNMQSFKITSNGITQNILPNEIRLNATNNQPVVSIDFDAFTDHILVKSTGAVTNPTFAGEEYFKIEIKNPNLVQNSLNTDLTASLNGNQNGDAIKNQLNSKAFELKDIIKLTYKEKDKVVITNYPNSGTPIYNPTKDDSESFEIDESNLRPFVAKLPNKITIKSLANQEVATIEFNKAENKFIVNSTGVIPDPSSTEPYFTLILREPRSFLQEKLNISLKGNENPTSFKDKLSDKSFSINDMLALIYKDKSKIEISNYPSSGEVYNPNHDADIFEITSVGLENSSMDSKIKILNDNNREICMIQFAKINNSEQFMIATANNLISTNTLENDKEYARLSIFQGSSGLNDSKILGKTNAKEFAKEFNNRRYNRGLFIFLLSSRLSNKVIITNYKGQNEYKVKPEGFELFNHNATSVMPTQLSDYNIIKLKNRDGSYVVYIYFNQTVDRLIVQLIGTIKNNDSDSFVFKLKKSNNVELKAQGTINKEETGDNFKNSLMGKYVLVNDIVELSYSDGSLVEITDYPRIGETYNPTGVSESFTITSSGLVKRT